MGKKCVLLLRLSQVAGEDKEPAVPGRVGNCMYMQAQACKEGSVRESYSGVGRAAVFPHPHMRHDMSNPVAVQVGHRV